MIGNLFLMLRARKLVGRTAGVYVIGERGATGVMIERVSLAGIEGELPDGDQTLIAWRVIGQIQVGPESDRGFARRREQLARHAESCPSCGDGHRTGSFSPTEIAAMLREPEGA